VSLSVVQWSKSAGEQGVLCTVITRMLLDHISIIVHMDIFLYHIALYSGLLLFRSIIYKVARFASDKTASGNLYSTYGKLLFTKTLLFPDLL
jgi:hypothetical protein